MSDVAQNAQPAQPHLKTSTRPRPVTGYIPILLTAFIAFCFSLLIYAPGYMSFDSIAQLRQARAFAFSDSHPPIMAALWHYVDFVSAGPFGMLLLQTMLYWLGLAIFFIYIPGWTVLRVLFLLLVGLYPPMFGNIGVVWKDILMIGSLMLGLGLTVQVHRSASTLLKVVIFLLIMALMIFATAARHNAIVAIPPLMFWLVHAFPFIHYKGRLRTATRAVLLGSILSLVVHFSADAITKALVPKSSNHWQYVALYDLAGISVYADKLMLDADAPVFTETATLDEIKKLYSPRTCGPLWQVRPSDEGEPRPGLCRHTTDPQFLDTLQSLWVSSIWSYPVPYLKHRIGTFAELMGATDSGLYSPVYWRKIRDNEFGFVFHASKLNVMMTSWLHDLCQTPIYRAWIYLIALATFAIICTVIYFARGGVVGLALSFSGLLYLVMYFPTSPSAHFRYNLWGIHMATLCVAYAVCLASAWITSRWRGDGKPQQQPAAHPIVPAPSHVPSAGEPASADARPTTDE